MTDVPFSNQYSLDKSTLSDAEQDYLNRVARWSQVEGGYYMLLSTKPLTVSYGFADSPVFFGCFYGGENAVVERKRDFMGYYHRKYDAVLDNEYRALCRKDYIGRLWAPGIYSGVG